MPTSAAGSSRPAAHAARGFTLLELLVTLTVLALATAGVTWALRDGEQDVLDRQAERLQAQMQVARQLARAGGAPVVLRLLPDGYAFDGLPASADAPLAVRHAWLDGRTSAQLLQGGSPLVLGPEPMIPPFRIQLSLGHARRTLATDGWASVAVE